MEQWEHLLEELRNEFILREEELELLHEIDVQLLCSERQPLNDTFDFIVRRSQELLKADRVIIFLRRGGSLEIAHSLDESILGQQLDISTRKFLTADASNNIPDVTVAPYADEYISISDSSGQQLRSLLYTPISVGQTMAGVFSAEGYRPHAFKPVHERIIAAIAAQIAIVLQRAQSFDRDKLFAEVDELIFATPESQQVISAALQKVMDALRVIEHVELSGAQIMFRRGSHELEVVHSTNPSEVGLVLEIEQSICGRAVRERKTITIGDVSSEPDYRRMLGSSIQSEIAIPILLGSSNVAIGVLNVESEQPDAFEGFCQVVLDSFADKVRTLLAFAKLRSDVTESMEVRNASDLLVAVGDQASNMIHRMNNTVGIMRLRILELQELEQRGELGSHPFLTESLAALRRQADQTLQMPEEVTRMLDQRGVKVNPNQVVREVLEKFEMPDNVTLDLMLDPDVPALPLFNFDLVVHNLLQNAVDAMPRGGTLSVSTLSVGHEDLAKGYIELTVRDTGTGISEDIIPRIFDLNFSTKHAKGSGHGLGLWWIRNFVLRAKGDISVASSQNLGAEFTVKIPIDRSA
jgi:signal transduction histidine kinase